MKNKKTGFVFHNESAPPGCGGMEEMMNKYKRSASLRFVSALLAIVFAFGCMAVSGMAYASEPPSSVGKVRNLVALRAGDDALSLKWDRVTGANGYAVYRYDGNRKKFCLLTTKKGVRNTAHVDRRLSPGKVYRYKVRAFYTSAGKKKYGKFSSRVAARSCVAGAKAVNAGKIVFEESVFNLGFDDTVKARAYVRPETAGKAKGKRPVTKKVRWYTSNAALATVSNSGTISTKRKTGECFIYAVAHNGIRGRIKVTVRDFAYPKQFDTTTVKGSAVPLLTTFQQDIKDIAAYYHLNRPSKLEVVSRSDGVLEIIPDEDYDLRPVYSAVMRILAGYPDENIMIRIEGRFLSFHITDIIGVNELGNYIYQYHTIRYYYNRDLYDWDPDLYDYVAIAPHWGYKMEIYDDRN